MCLLILIGRRLDQSKERDVVFGCSFEDICMKERTLRCSFYFYFLFSNLNSSAYRDYDRFLNIRKPS